MFNGNYRQQISTIYFSNPFGADDNVIGRDSKWWKLKEIVIKRNLETGYKIQFILKNGNIETLTMDSAIVGVKGYWHGLPVIAKGWIEINNIKRGRYLKKTPRSPNISCSGANKCDGSVITKWGVWDFVAKDGFHLTGLITGGFGIDRPNAGKRAAIGISPDKLTNLPFVGISFDSKKFEVGTGYFNVIRSLDFSKLDSSMIGIKFENKHNGFLKLNKNSLADFHSKGYLIWSMFGKYPAKCIVKANNLEKMVSIKTKSIYKTIDKSLRKIKTLATHWQVEMKSGDYYKVNDVEGIQNQLVPKRPAKGFYWFIKPPQVPGEIGGRYVVSPNSMGYCLIPLSIISKLDPLKKQIVLTENAGGKQYPFSRFHPGTRWINNGISGLQYVDEDVDNPIKNEKIWLLYQLKGAKKKMGLWEIRMLKQIKK